MHAKLIRAGSVEVLLDEVGGDGEIEAVSALRRDADDIRLFERFSIGDIGK